jgi:DNA-directed RNA polymerase subunit L
MQSKRVEEVDGVTDKYNPLPMSITYEDDNTCDVYMRREGHTMSNLFKHELMKSDDVQYIGCGMVHPPDIHILQLKMRTAPGATPEQELRTALRSVRAQAAGLRERWLTALRSGGWAA